MLRMSIPNGIPGGIRHRISEVGSRSGESRNSTPVDVLWVSGCLKGGSKSIHLTVTYPTAGAWMAAGAAEIGGGWA